MTNLINVVVIGTGGHAKVVAETILLDGRYLLAGFANEKLDIKEFLDYPVRRAVSDFKVAHFIVAIGANDVRAKVFEENIKEGLTAVTAVHPRAIVSPSAVIEAGTIIAAGAIVNPLARIGRNCIINTGAIVEHDCVIGDHVHLAPGTKLSGNVSVEESAFLGIGTTVIPEIKIGKFSRAGAGAVVINSISPFTTVVGVPAKVLERGRTFQSSVGITDGA